LLIGEAIAAGAKCLCGGNRNGAMVEATLPEDVPPNQPVYGKEAFGPVAVLSKFCDFADAIRLVNDSGLGREGIRYAIEDMTEPRLLVIREDIRRH
jgi:acyl-CoA reductase-like NAD-dependent aldehyde dehydrogenase